MGSAENMILPLINGFLKSSLELCRCLAIRWIFRTETNKKGKSYFRPCLMSAARNIFASRCPIYRNFCVEWSGMQLATDGSIVYPKIPNETQYTSNNSVGMQKVVMIIKSSNNLTHQDDRTYISVIRKICSYSVSIGTNSSLILT